MVVASLSKTILKNMHTMSIIVPGVQEVIPKCVKVVPNPARSQVQQVSRIANRNVLSKRNWPGERGIGMGELKSPGKGNKNGGIEGKKGNWRRGN